jgi:phosphatidylinositol 3-kinase
MGANEFRFFLSCDINSPVTFRIEKLDGNLPVKKSSDSGVVSIAEEKKPELYIECALYIDGAPFGLPMRTRLKTTGPPYCWNELITLSSKYRDLTAHSQLAITVNKNSLTLLLLLWYLSPFSAYRKVYAHIRYGMFRVAKLRD